MATTADPTSPGWKTREQRRFAFALMAIAGWCDAAGFLLFAQLYVSFMSGDATQLGVNVAHADWGAAAKFLGAQFVFVVGAGVGRYYRVRDPNTGRRVILGANAVLLAATALLGGDALGLPAFVFAVLAMGMQNAALTHEAGVLVGTMITGTLARLGFSIADRLNGRPGSVGDNVGQWAFFVVGAGCGAVAFHFVQHGAFWVPAVASLLLIPAAMRLPAMVETPNVSAA